MTVGALRRTVHRTLSSILNLFRYQVLLSGSKDHTMRLIGSSTVVVVVKVAAGVLSVKCSSGRYQSQICRLLAHLISTPATIPSIYPAIRKYVMVHGLNAVFNWPLTQRHSIARSPSLYFSNILSKSS